MLMTSDSESKLEIIKEAIAAGRIKALTLDTSVFDRNSLRLESGLLRRLSQFSENNVLLILSDVVEREVIRHITTQMLEVKQEAEKALTKLARTLTQETEVIAEFRSSVLENKNPHSLALERFQSFKNDTGLQIVCTDEYVTVDMLMYSYLNSDPPFAATGSKKHEFPDAITLLAIEAWAKEENGLVLAVSTDRDWESFCSQSNHIEFLGDLSVALSLFQIQDASQACMHLYERYQRGEIPEIDKRMNYAVSDELEAIDLDPVAASNFRYELDTTTFFVNTLQLDLPRNGGAPFKPVQFSESEITVEASVTASISVDFVFAFFTFDSVDREGEDVSLGSGSSSVDKSLSFRILITLSGNLSNLGGIIEIEDIEATLLDRPVFDCGEIEPDWLHDER